MRPSNILIGFLLALAVAYVHDASTTSLSADGQRQNILNWEVLGRSTTGIVDWARDQIEAIANRVHKPD